MSTCMGCRRKRPPDESDLLWVLSIVQRVLTPIAATRCGAPGGGGGGGRQNVELCSTQLVEVGLSLNVTAGQSDLLFVWYISQGVLTPYVVWCVCVCGGGGG